MATLSANIEDLEQAVKLLCEILPQFDDLKSDVQSIASELNDKWDGAASVYYVSKLRSHLKPLGDTQEALEAFKEYAEQAKYDMKKLDEMLNNMKSHWIIQFPEEAKSNSSASSNKSTSTEKSSSSSKTTKKNNAIDDMIEAITKPVENVINGIKTLLGGKK